jgi:hypothetical protein
LVAKAMHAMVRSPGQFAIPVAVGLAVPAIEAWCLCGKEPNVSEDAWVQGMAQRRWPYTKARLKELAYGTDHPSIPLATARAVEHMRRAAGDLELLARKFPVGLGSMIRALRAW